MLVADRLDISHRQFRRQSLTIYASVAGRLKVSRRPSSSIRVSATVVNRILSAHGQWRRCGTLGSFSSPRLLASSLRLCPRDADAVPLVTAVTPSAAREAGQRLWAVTAQSSAPQPPVEPPICRAAMIWKWWGRAQSP